MINTMSGYSRASPPQTTRIENFLDLNEIMSSNGNGTKGISSVEGYPAPPHVNSNFVQQMVTENYERDTAMKPIQNSRIRQTNPQQLQLAMNGGAIESYMPDDFQLGPVARQNLARSVEGYQEAPKPQSITYPQHPALPQNSAQTSNYHESYVMPSPQFNCLDVASHIQKCPLCSKFYENDRSMYWGAIVFLALVCIYLLKKLIDAKK